MNACRSHKLLPALLIVALALVFWSERNGSRAATGARQAKPPGEARGVRLVENPQGAQVGQVYGASHALLIGINRYAHLPPTRQLHFAVSDAEDLRRVLVDSYGFLPQNVHTLINEQANMEAIRHALSDLADKRKIHPQDRVLIYFAGHGQTVTLPEGGEMGFLLPADANVDIDDPANAGPYLDTCLQMSDVWNRLDACPAKHILLMADACFSGLLAQPRGGGKMTAATLTIWGARRARQVMTAGGKGESSQERADLGHGVFTYQLLEELRARAQEPETAFTTTELYSVLATAVSNQTSAAQTPQLAKHKMEGEFLFITAPGKPAPVPVAPTVPKPADGPDLVPTNGGKRPAPGVAPAPTKEKPRDGSEMLLVPAGEFLMGSEEGNSNEKPPHKVAMDGFFISKNLVTVRQFRDYDRQNGSKFDWNGRKPEWGWKDDHPMVRVTWDEAVAYGKWAFSDDKNHLPTEAQWEKAARGTEGRKYPWGNKWDGSRLWRSRDKFGDAGETAPVGSFPTGASLCGALDMAGNVWQWCADWYDADAYKNPMPGKNPAGPMTGKERAIRGVGWGNFDPDDFRATNRRGSDPAGSNTNLGFRLVSVP